jgi:hypothetical protein
METTIQKKQVEVQKELNRLEYYKKSAMERNNHDKVKKIEGYISELKGYQAKIGKPKKKRTTKEMQEVVDAFFKDVSKAFKTDLRKYNSNATFIPAYYPHQDKSHRNYVEKIINSVEGDLENLKSNELARPVKIKEGTLMRYIRKFKDLLYISDNPDDQPKKEDIERIKQEIKEDTVKEREGVRALNQSVTEARKQYIILACKKYDLSLDSMLKRGRFFEEKEETDEDD